MKNERTLAGTTKMRNGERENFVCGWKPCALTIKRYNYKVFMTYKHINPVTMAEMLNSNKTLKLQHYRSTNQLVYIPLGDVCLPMYEPL